MGIYPRTQKYAPGMFLPRLRAGRAVRLLLISTQKFIPHQPTDGCGIILVDPRGNYAFGRSEKDILFGNYRYNIVTVSKTYKYLYISPFDYVSIPHSYTFFEQQASLSKV